MQGFRVAICLSFLSFSLEAIANTSISSTVPLVGCKPSPLMDGGVVPFGKLISVSLPVSIASHIAAYEGANLVVMAPRGWYCTYSTVGQEAEVIVSPPNNVGNTSGPLVSERFSDVGTPSNVMHTLGLGGQLFPQVITSFEFSNEAHFLGFSSPTEFINSGKIIKVYSSDRLKYVGKNMVEYETRPNTLGVGSQFLGPWADGISPGTTTPTQYLSSGFVQLQLISEFSKPIDNLKGLYVFGMRLPDSLNYLSPYILKANEQQTLENDRKQK